MEPRRLPRYKYSSICARCYKSGRIVGAQMLEFLHLPLASGCSTVGPGSTARDLSP
jgi:hypothetical protein